MGCKICGKSACMASFHSLAEQEQYNKYDAMDDRELRTECVDKENEIVDLNSRIEELEKWQVKVLDAYPSMDLE